MHSKDTHTYLQNWLFGLQFSCCCTICIQCFFFFFFCVFLPHKFERHSTSQTQVMRIELKLVAFLSIHHRNLHGSRSPCAVKIFCNFAFVTLFVVGYYSFYSQYVGSLQDWFSVLRSLFFVVVIWWANYCVVRFAAGFKRTREKTRITQNNQLILFKINEKLRIAFQLFLFFIHSFHSVSFIHFNSNTLNRMEIYA